MKRFVHPKLPETAAEDLRVCPIRTVSPYALMLGPVYVFLRKNAKFVAVKTPMDFFLPDELERLYPFENFFFPQSVDPALEFRDTARRVKSLLSSDPMDRSKGPLSPAPYEVSDAVLRLVAPLWGPRWAANNAPSNSAVNPQTRDPAVESFFVSVFCGELCELFPAKLLVEARESDQEVFERAVLRSSWVVFLSLLLGFTDLPYLNSCRLEAFEAELRGEASLNEIHAFCRQTLPDPIVARLTLSSLRERKDRTSRMIASRLERIVRELAPFGVGPSPTLLEGVA